MNKRMLEEVIKRVKSRHGPGVLDIPPDHSDLLEAAILDLDYLLGKCNDRKLEAEEDR
jgi:hypothetical protein